MLSEMRSLRKLNLSNNVQLSLQAVVEIVAALKAVPELQDVDLSKLNCNAVEVFKEIADFVIHNKHLRSLALQRTGMTDALANYLTEPLVRAQQIETLKFDFN